MFDRLVRLLKGELVAEGHEPGRFPRRLVAVATLLIVAMHADRHVDAAERAAIRALLSAHFGLDEDEVAALLAEAEMRHAQSLDHWEYVESVRAGFTPAERLAVLTMLWEVCYADGRLAPLEDRLLEELASQLEMDFDAVEVARAAAVARAGLIAPGGSLD